MLDETVPRVIVYEKTIDPYDEDSIAEIVMMFGNVYYPTFVDKGVMHMQRVDYELDRLN